MCVFICVNQSVLIIIIIMGTMNCHLNQDRLVRRNSNANRCRRPLDSGYLQMSPFCCPCWHSSTLRRRRPGTCTRVSVFATFHCSCLFVLNSHYIHPTHPNGSFDRGPRYMLLFRSVHYCTSPFSSQSPQQNSGQCRIVYACEHHRSKCQSRLQFPFRNSQSMQTIATRR